MCGGPNGLSLYSYGAVDPTDPGTTTSTSSSATSTTAGTAPTQGVLASYNGWGALDCYVDDAARKLPVAMGTTGGPGAMTVELCLDACHASNYLFAGLEYSQECYCGNTAPPEVATDGRCTMLCNGNKNEICGGNTQAYLLYNALTYYLAGPYGLTVYQYGIVVSSSSSTTATTSSSSTTGGSTTTSSTSSTSPTPTGPSTLQTYGNWESQGCYNDVPGTRTLGVTLNMNQVDSPQLCMDACYNAGYSYAGVYVYFLIFTDLN